MLGTLPDAASIAAKKTGINSQPVGVYVLLGKMGIAQTRTHAYTHTHTWELKYMVRALRTLQTPTERQKVAVPKVLCEPHTAGHQKGISLLDTRPDHPQGRGAMDGCVSWLQVGQSRETG